MFSDQFLEFCDDEICFCFLEVVVAFSLFSCSFGSSEFGLTKVKIYSVKCRWSSRNILVEALLLMYWDFVFACIHCCTRVRIRCIIFCKIIYHTSFLSFLCFYKFPLKFPSYFMVGAKCNISPVFSVLLVLVWLAWFIMN